MFLAVLLASYPCISIPVKLILCFVNLICLYQKPSSIYPETSGTNRCLATKNSGCLIPIQERYNLYRELFGKYRSYRMDSALWVANQRVELAKRMKNPPYIRSAELNIAEVMIGVAMYKGKGLEILDGIKSR